MENKVISSTGTNWLKQLIYRLSSNITNNIPLTTAAMESLRIKLNQVNYLIDGIFV